jgi:uncharacterized membrane protein YfcA
MPALLGVVGLTASRAVGTNLLVGFALGLAGLLAHASRHEVEWDLLGIGVAGALIGGWFGARLTGRLSEDTLRRAIGGALLAVSLAFVVDLAVR